MGLKEREVKTYAKVIADGSIRVKADAATDPKATTRTYIDGNNVEQTVTERVYHELSGHIKSITFEDGKFGKTLNIVIEDGGEPIVFQMNMQSNFAEDFLKKLPNVVLTKEVILKPYSFEDDKKRLQKGVSIYQNGEKLKSFFQEGAGKETKNINGYPDVPKDWKEMDKDDWKIYFITVRKHLQKFTEDNIVPVLVSLSDESFDLSLAKQGAEAGESLEEAVGANPFSDTLKEGDVKVETDENGDERYVNNATGQEVTPAETVAQ